MDKVEITLTFDDYDEVESLLVSLYCHLIKCQQEINDKAYLNRLEKRIKNVSRQLEEQLPDKENNNG